MLEVYTDGCCKGNPGPGGWAFVVYENSIKKGHKKGAETHTTNNAMELLAVLKALEWANAHNITIDVLYSDSKYVLNAITSWMPGWAAKGWRTASGTEVKNKDLCKAIFALKDKVVRYEHVKGHSGNLGNEMADLLANEAFLSVAW